MESRGLGWNNFNWTVKILGPNAKTFNGTGAFARLGSVQEFEITTLPSNSADLIVYIQFSEDGAWVLPISANLPIRCVFVEAGVPFTVDNSLKFCISRSDRHFANATGPSIQTKKVGNNPNFLYLNNGSIKGPADNRRLIIPTGFSLIGSSSNCNLRLVHRSIVGTHTLLFRCPSSNEVRVVDLGKSLRTKLENEVPLGDLIMDGMTLKVGKLELNAISKSANSQDISVTKAIPIGEAVARSTDAVFLENYDESPVPKNFRDSTLPPSKDVSQFSRRLDSVERELSSFHSKNDGDALATLRAVRSDVDKCMRSVAELNDKLALLIANQEVILDNIVRPRADQSTDQSCFEFNRSKSSYPDLNNKSSNSIANDSEFSEVDRNRPFSESSNITEDAEPEGKVGDKETLVLDRFVELRSQDDVRNRMRLAVVLIAATVFLAASLPIVWYSVPIGWRARIFNDISSVHSAPKLAP